MNHFELPERSGAYRWYYVDVTSGDLTAVFIFMVGSIFSARYSLAVRKGGLPREHAAVNFALYERGVRRLWVLSEYGDVKVSDDSRTLHIGDSWLHYDQHGLKGEVRDRTTPFLLTQWGRPTHVQLDVTAEGPTGQEHRLVDGLDHYWRPIAAKSRARVRVKSAGVDFEGAAYHDGNHGGNPLGSDIRGWEWMRIHTPQRTSVLYRPWDEVPPWRVDVSENSTLAVRANAPLEPHVRSAWGLKVPSELEGLKAQLVESSPFYARLEAGTDQHHALGEVADFARFHSPTVRWMARFKTRAGGVA